MATPLYIDSDLGTDVDDALALSLAALDPRFDLRGVSTVNGPVHERAAQVRGWLELCGRSDVPVGVGHPHPIGGPTGQMPVDLVADGPTAVLFDPPSSEALLVEVLRAATSPVHVCAIGALTNIARDLAKHPELFDRVGALHVMAGCLGDDPIPEFNLNGDPDASRVVLSLPLPIVLAPYDVTRQLCLDDDDYLRIGACGELGAALARQMDRWLRFCQRWDASPRVRLHDPLSVLDVVDAAATEKEELSLSLAGEAGSLVFVESPHGRPVSVIRAADEARLRAAVVSAVESVVKDRRSS